MPTTKAIATGVIFGGLVDCYVLDDGRRVLSQRGAVRALRAKTSSKNDGAEFGNLSRYTARLPEKFRHLATEPTCEIDRPDGGSAHAVTSDHFVAILNAYVDSAIAGELSKSQRHLAANAQAILRSLQSLGLDALIDEATGYQRQRADDALSRRFAEYLRETAAPHKVTFKEKLVRELCRVYGKVYVPGRHPRWLASVNEKLYRTIFDGDVAAELKARNPTPHFGSNHHQFVSDQVRPLMRDDLEVIYVLARTSQSAADFWRRCEYHFKRSPMQLGLDAAE